MVAEDALIFRNESRCARCHTALSKAIALPKLKIAMINEQRVDICSAARGNLANQGRGLSSACQFRSKLREAGRGRSFSDMSYSAFLLLVTGTCLQVGTSCRHELARFYPPISI